MDAVFDMFSIKQDDYPVSEIYCGFGDNAKNELIIKHLESLATGGRYPNMPQADYFLVIMRHLYLTEKEVTEISQLFYARLFYQKIDL